MSDIVIRVENLSKLYQLGEVGTGTLSRDINRWWAKFRGQEDPYAKVGQLNDRTQKVQSGFVWALKDINFEVKQGEVLGVIGRNGAGKSTLLKILSKITSPTTGKIYSKGRIASLLEVGTGFHPEMTGRENIYLNGAILGMLKCEINKKFDEIVDFAGVEAYIDTPVKRYSSGMYVRLAFAVAAFLEPEILIVDEVLAVGDVEFQKKCSGRMKDVSINDGRTVLFVSHNMSAIQYLCDSAIVLGNGELKYCSSTMNSIDYFLKMNLNEAGNFINDHSLKDFSILSVSYLNGDSNTFKFNDEIIFKISITNILKLKRGFNIGVAVLDSMKRKLFTTVYKVDYLAIKERYELKIPPRVLLGGNYSIDIATFSSDGVVYCYLNDICPFEIVDFESTNSIYKGDVGSLFIECNWI